MSHRIHSTQTYEQGVVSFLLGNLYLMQSMAQQARDLVNTSPKDQVNTWAALASALDQKCREVAAKPSHLLVFRDNIASFPLPLSSQAIRRRLADKARQMSEENDGPAFSVTWGNLAEALRKAARTKGS